MTMQQRIETTLNALLPVHLDVLDESHMHSRGLQTHFKAVVVSEQFAGLNSVKRHQKVYATLGDLMGSFTHWRCTPTPLRSGPRPVRRLPRRLVPVAASTDRLQASGFLLDYAARRLCRRVFSHPVHPLRG